MVPPSRATDWRRPAEQSVKIASFVPSSLSITPMNFTVIAGGGGGGGGPTSGGGVGGPVGFGGAGGGGGVGGGRNRNGFLSVLPSTGLGSASDSRCTSRLAGSI